MRETESNKIISGLKRAGISYYDIINIEDKTKDLYKSRVWTFLNKIFNKETEHYWRGNVWDSTREFKSILNDIENIDIPTMIIHLEWLAVMVMELIE